MKILYYSGNPAINLESLSGYGTHIREMLNAFRNLGHQVLPVIAGGISDETKRPENKLRLKGLMKKWFPEFLWESAKDLVLLKKDHALKRMLVQKVKEFEPDLIYERASYLQLSGLNTAKKCKLKYLVEINAPLTDERIFLQGKTAFKNQSDAVEEQLINGAHTVAVVSSALKKYFVQKYNSAPGKFLITPNAVDLRKTSVNEERVRNLKHRYGLEKDHIIIGFAGSVFKYHGVDVLLRSFEQISAKYKNVFLMIVGSGGNLLDLTKKVNESHLKDKVIFTGNVNHSEVFEHIELFDIGVLANTKEYMSPVKLFEYGSMQKAIIAPGTPAVREVMNHGEDGILIKPGEEELTKALITLIDDEHYRKLIAQTFYKKVVENHTWDKRASSILSIVSAL